MSRTMLRTKTEKINTVKNTKYLSTVLYVAYTYMRLAIGKRYRTTKDRLFFIPEFIFFGSGLYAANIFSKITLLNGAKIPVAIKVKITVMIILMSIAFNLVDIVRMGRQC